MHWIPRQLFIDPELKIDPGGRENLLLVLSLSVVLSFYIYHYHRLDGKYIVTGSVYCRQVS